jgi:hypothetical protein
MVGENQKEELLAKVQQPPAHGLGVPLAPSQCSMNALGAAGRQNAAPVNFATLLATLERLDLHKLLIMKGERVTRLELAILCF